MNWDAQSLATIIASVLATVVAVFAAMVTLNQFLHERQQTQLSNQRAERELFEKFNKRFDKLNESLNDILAGEYTPNKKNKKKPKEAVCQDYLNLCSEEFLWYKKGLIGDEIWSAWKLGIQYYLGRESNIRLVFEREKKVAPNSYYGLFSELKFPDLKLI